MNLHRAAIVTLVLSTASVFSLIGPAAAQARAGRSPARAGAPAGGSAPAAVRARAAEQGAPAVPQPRIDPEVVRERMRQAIESGARDAAIARRMSARLVARGLSQPRLTREQSELRRLDPGQREIVIEAARAAQAVLARARADALEISGGYDRAAAADPTIVRADAGHGEEFEELRAVRHAARTELDAIAQRVLAVLTPEQVSGFEQRLAARGIESTADRVLHRIGLLLLMPDTIRVLEAGRPTASDADASTRIRSRAPHFISIDTLRADHLGSPPDRSGTAR